MPPINERAFHYLVDEWHTGGELSSFSFEKGRESTRTTIANIFRGNQQRCLELINECEKILNDEERLNSLNHKQIKSLVHNAGNLKDELESTANHEKADRVFQAILVAYRKRPDYPTR